MLSIKDILAIKYWLVPPILLSIQHAKNVRQTYKIMGCHKENIVFFHIESAITTGNLIMLLAPTMFSLTKSLCINLRAEFLSGDFFEAV